MAQWLPLQTVNYGFRHFGVQLLGQALFPRSRHPASPFVLQPITGGLWINEPSVTIRQFNSALKALNIRERRQYDTRHTYATLCLMPCMNPAFIANQLGHNVEMLLATYAKMDQLLLGLEGAGEAAAPSRIGPELAQH